MQRRRRRQGQERGQADARAKEGRCHACISGNPIVLICVHVSFAPSVRPRPAGSVYKAARGHYGHIPSWQCQSPAGRRSASRPTAHPRRNLRDRSNGYYQGGRRLCRKGAGPVGPPAGTDNGWLTAGACPPVINSSSPPFIERMHAEQPHYTRGRFAKHLLKLQSRRLAVIAVAKGLGQFVLEYMGQQCRVRR